MIERLDVATALLIDFSTKTTTFQSWMLEKSNELAILRTQSGDPSNLANSRQNFKKIDEEIRSKKNDLTEIHQLAIKIETEISNYIEEIRKKEVSKSYPNLHYHEIRETAKRVQV